MPIFAEFGLISTNALLHIIFKYRILQLQLLLHANLRKINLEAGTER